MRSGTATASALLCGAMAIGWASPASANHPTRPPVQRPTVAEPGELDELSNYSDIAVTQPHSWDDVAGPLPREVPTDGRGRLAVGSGVVVVGGLLMAGAVMLAVGGREPAIWVSPMVVGAGGVLTGGLLIGSGRRRLGEYREWESARPDAVPQQGHGLVGAGAVLLIGGAALGVSGTILWGVSSFGYQETQRPLPAYVPTLVGVGVGSLAVGTALMIVGRKRHERFQAWRARPQLVPGISPTAGGVQIGLSGRF